MSDAVLQAWDVPAVIRGTVLDCAGDVIPGRRGGATLRVPHAAVLADALPLSDPTALADLAALRLDDVLEFLDALGRRLDFAKNGFLRDAYALARQTSGLSDAVLRRQYESIADFFDIRRTRLAAANAGLDGPDGWMPQPDVSGGRSRIRAFGARTVHIIAGNAPGIAAYSIINGALTRSDTLIKAPSNDPLTAVAIGRTMVDMNPLHPITRHVAVACWRGGDEAVEARLYQPRNIDKIVAWGGHSSMNAVRRHLQPGVDLIALDPKLSLSLIGHEAFRSEAELRKVAAALARDVGFLNQEACFSSRVAYVLCGTDARGVALANRLGDLTMEAMRDLPEHESAPHKVFDAELSAEIDGLRFIPSEFRVFGGRGAEGAVIVSQHDAPVDFARRLACRVVNIVPIEEPGSALRAMDTQTQTVGVYPDELREALRDQLAMRGVQRIAALGAAGREGAPGGPHDGMELLRRMCRWCVADA